MADQGESSLQDKLQELEAIFAARLPGKMAELREALARCFEQAPEVENLHTLYRLIHSLAGSAGIFGFHELGVRVRELEYEFKPLVSASQWPGEELIRQGHKLEELLLWAEKNPKGEPAPSDADEAAGEAYELPPARLIFVAEQDPVQGEEIASQLEYFGFDVLLLTDLAQLEAALNSQLPDAIVLGLGFEGGQFVGAPEVASLRQEIQSRIPTIFVSRETGFEVRLAAVRFGVSGFFSKPLDLLALTDQIDSMTLKNEKEPARVLIVDDDPDSAMYYGLILRDAGISIRLLHQPAEILQTLAECQPELILMDVYMPGCNGMELAGIVRQDNRHLDVPIVFLSSDDDLGRQLRAIRCGADEFLTKPISPEHLLLAVNSRIERYRGLRALIERDGLTGLYKHAACKEQLAREVARVRRSNGMLAIAMIDLDYFKSINDRFGHPVGDQVLRALARLLLQRLRRSDISGRYGGEEFMVIFPETSARVARVVLDRIRESFSKIRHFCGTQDFSASFSAGVVEYSGTQTASEFIVQADQVLYRAKDNGRNCVLAQESRENPV